MRLKQVEFLLNRSQRKLLGARPASHVTEYRPGAYDRRRNNTSIWRTDDGDLVGIYLFDERPSLPLGDGSADDFKRQWRSIAESKGADVFVLDICHVATVSAIRSIVRYTSPELKTVDIGAITIPFRDFFYAVKIECHDCPPIAFHETILMDQTLKDDDVPLSKDPNGQTHTLTRVWTWMPRIESALRLAETIKAMPCYPLPGPAAPGDTCAQAFGASFKPPFNALP